MNPNWYADNRQALITLLSGHGIPCFDYFDLVQDRLFSDNDPMLPDGNCKLAHQLALETAPRIMAGIH